MKKILISAVIIMASSISLAKPLILDTSDDETTFVYTLYGGAYIGISSGLEVNLVIDGLALKATTESDNPPFTKIVLPSILVNKMISKAEIKKWIVDGKTYQCKADNLPLNIVQGKDFNSSSQIHFTCSQI